MVKHKVDTRNEGGERGGCWHGKHDAHLRETERRVTTGIRDQGGRRRAAWCWSVRVYIYQRAQAEAAVMMWIAREKLSAPGRRTDLVTNVTRLHTWAEYCREIGIDRATAHRWLAIYEGMAGSRARNPGDDVAPPGFSKKSMATPPFDESARVSWGIHKRGPTFGSFSLSQTKCT